MNLTAANFTDEQLQAITTIDRNVSVCAGAGSGKTRVLVERFLYILEQARIEHKPVDAVSIGAITFTRKAAGEMRGRLRKEMLERQQQGDPDGFWTRQISALDRANICTIDSLCSSILKENPVEAELDPGFAITEELELNIFKSQVLDAYLDSLFNAKSPAVFKLFAQYGYEKLREQLLSLLDDLPELCQEQDLAAPYRVRLEQAPALKEQFLLAVEILGRDRDNFVKSKTSKTYGALARLESEMKQIAQELEASPPVFTTFEKSVKGIRITDAAGKDLLAEAKSRVKELQFLELDRKALELLPAWQGVLQGLGTALAAKLLEQEKLGFGEIERKALELLETHPQVRQRYRDRFAYLMVDEFQDTDDVQRKLIYLLCGGDEDKLQGEKLFIVGDPKQSIYGFRGADVSVFKRVQQDIAAVGGLNLQLSRNFRSLDKVLELVNAAFERVMGNNGLQDVVFEPLDFQRQGAEKDKPVLFDLQYGDDLELSLYADKHEAEAGNLANTLLRLHQEGQSYGEMTILLRAMSKVHYVTEALQRAGLPYNLVDGKGFYSQQEVLDLLNFFAYLENPGRILELVGVLRSPYVGLTDAAITEAILGEETLAAVIPEPIQKLAAAARLLPLPLLWEEVWGKLHIEDILLAQEQGENKLANVKKLRRLAVDFAQQQPRGTLAGWLEQVRVIRAAEVRETTANLDRTDAVNIMTMHKAKGLEFSTIFVPFLSDSDKNTGASIAYKAGMGLGISVGASYGNTIFEGTGGFEASGVLREIQELQKQKEHEEKARLLYVAMTRAKDRLFMSGQHKIDQTRCSDDARSIADMHSWFNQLLAIVQLSDAAERVVMPLNEIPLLTAQPEEEERQTEAQLQEKLPHYKSWGKKIFSPSTLQAYEHCPRAFYYEELLRLPRFAAEADASKEKAMQVHTPASITGLVIHKTLELYQDETGAYEDLETAYKEAVHQEGKGFDTGKAWSMLQSYVASPLGKSVPRQHQRELEFFYEAKGLTLNGIVDCIYENSDGTLIIVDYKTGNPPEPGEVKLGYAWQLAIYKAAVEEKTGKTVKGCELHFLQNNSLWRLPEDHDYYHEAIDLCLKLHNAESVEEFSCRLDNCQWCDYAYLCPFSKYTL